MGSNEKETRIIASAQKCLQILSYMATANEELSINDLTVAMDINKSTMHHYLATLVGEKFVIQNQENKKYKIGAEAFRVGESYLRKDLPYQEIDILLKDFYEELGTSVYFYIRSAEKATCVLAKEKKQVMYGHNMIGSTVPMHASAAGKVFLAYLPEYERERILKKTGLIAYTKKTISDYEILNKELVEIRIRGYAVNDCEYNESVSLAVPVFGFADKIVGSVSVAGDPAELTDKQMKKIIKPLINCGKIISEKVNNVVLY